MAGVTQRPEEGAKQMHAGLQAVELTVVDTNTPGWGAFPIPELGVNFQSCR